MSQRLPPPAPPSSRLAIESLPKYDRVRMGIEAPCMGDRDENHENAARWALLASEQEGHNVT